MGRIFWDELKIRGMTKEERRARDSGQPRTGASAGMIGFRMNIDELVPALPVSIVQSDYTRQVRRLVFDSSSLIKLEEINCAFESFCFSLNKLGCELYFPAPLLTEVGFNTEAQKNVKQEAFIQKISRMKESDAIDRHPDVVGDFRAASLYVPSRQEWYAVRHLLIQEMTTQKTKISTRRALSLIVDALIWCCAKNLSASVVTENDTDFLRFNKTNANVGNFRPKLIHVESLVSAIGLAVK